MEVRRSPEPGGRTRRVRGGAPEAELRPEVTRKEAEAPPRNRQRSVPG